MKIVDTKKIKESEQREIKELFQEILKTNDLQKFNIKELVKVLEPDTLLERFAARKANQVGANKDFIEIKGQKGQIENTGVKAETENELIGFKCLHYSVTESSGHVELTIVKKVNTQDVSFGVRTVDGTAKEPSEYEAYDDTYTMSKRDNELQI